MRNNEERICRLHERAKQLRKERDKRTLILSGGISTVLFLALIASIGIFRSHLIGNTDGIFTGASLLSDSVGGYVLVGIIAFMLGVSITVMIRQLVVKKGGSDHREEEKSDRPSLLSDESLLMAAGGSQEDKADNAEKDNERNGKKL